MNPLRQRQVWPLLNRAVTTAAADLLSNGGITEAVSAFFGNVSRSAKLIALHRLFPNHLAKGIQCRAEGGDVGKCVGWSIRDEEKAFARIFKTWGT